MKKLLTILSLLLLVIASCKKEDNLVVLEGGTAPVLTKNTTAPLTLVKDNKDESIVTLNWTNPNYTLNTGLNPQTVSYLIQIDKAGSNFSSPQLQEISVSGDLKKVFTVGELNAILTKMELAEDVAHNLELRLKSTLGATAAALYSNVTPMTITPYLDVVIPLPTSGELYITGGAAPGGWQSGDGDAAPAGHKFTKATSTSFELIVVLKANESYLLLPKYGTWAAKYGFTGAKNGNNVNGDTFQEGGEDFKAPAETATYKITVEFKTGRFTVVKQ